MEKWRQDLADALRVLEKSHPDSQSVHQFRRTLESCNKKKADKLLPQLEAIYKDCCTHAKDPDFVEWLMGQGYKLSLGMKQVTLVERVQPEVFVQHLLWSFAHFNPALDDRVQEEKKSLLPILSKLVGMPISGKQLRKAKRLAGV